MEAFVYCWTDKLTNKLYVGSHKGSINDGYICSSSYMLSEYNKRPNDFSRQIVARGNYKDILVLEHQILISADAANDSLFYNISNGYINKINISHIPKLNVIKEYSDWGIQPELYLAIEMIRNKKTLSSNLTKRIVVTQEMMKQTGTSKASILAFLIANNLPHVPKCPSCLVNELYFSNTKYGFSKICKLCKNTEMSKNNVENNKHNTGKRKTTWKLSDEGKENHRKAYESWSEEKKELHRIKGIQAGLKSVSMRSKNFKELQSERTKKYFGNLENRIKHSKIMKQYYKENS